MLKIVVDIKTKSDWLSKFQLKKSAKKVENFQLIFLPTFSALFSDIAQSRLNCACTYENLGRILRIKNAKFSEYYFFMNWSIYKDFQICISVPLISLKNFDFQIKLV